MPFVVDRLARPLAPFGFGAAQLSPYSPGDQDAIAAGPLPSWSGAAPQALNVMDDNTQTWRTPGFSPVPPDIFGEWRKHAELGLMGLLHALKPPEEAIDDSGCEEEWKKARETCAEELARRYPIRGRTGGYKDIENCARGWVSQRCGGNLVAYNRPRGPKRW